MKSSLFHLSSSSSSSSSSIFLYFFHVHRTLFCGLAGACMNPGSFFKLSFCTFACLSNNSLISSWISAKFVSALLPCMLYLSYYFQPEVNTWIYLRKAFTLQVDSCHNLYPLQLICINIWMHNLRILMYYSVVKVKRYFRLEVFKIKL